MPGIAGLVSSKPAAECEEIVATMVATMMHEPFYEKGSYSSPELGCYVGWASLAMAPGPAKISLGKNDDLVLVLSGEIFVGAKRLEDLEGDNGDRSNIVSRLRGDNPQEIFEQLNGLFSGFLVDKEKRRGFLFNDRYGFDRVHVVEKEDATYFASEAKALLRVLPELREFDESGLLDFLSFGCAVENRTLFRDVSLLPAASLWTFENGSCRKKTYFSPATWEAQSCLTTGEFQEAFDETVVAAAPKYFEAQSTPAISLTAGLDSRVLLAAQPAGQDSICYTYDGARGETLDAFLAAKVAAAAGHPHQLLRVKADFFSRFPALAERTVYLSDGTFGPTGAHEIYLSNAARALAPIRLTGVFGGEIFRGVSTFKPLGLDRRSLEPSVAEKVKERTQLIPTAGDHPVTRAAFKEIPWSIFGSVASCRSQLSFRTPYLDNALVALAYRMPEALRGTADVFEGMIKRRAPPLARIPTDMGMLGYGSDLKRLTRQTLAKATFKLDYLWNDGMPHWVASVEPILESINSKVPLFGRHKYLSYRRWFRSELADYVREALASSSSKRSGLWNKAFIKTLADEHVSGRANFLQEINAVLMLDAVERSLFSR